MYFEAWNIKTQIIIFPNYVFTRVSPCMYPWSNYNDYRWSSIFIFCYSDFIINIRRTRSRVLMSLCNLHFRLVHISFFGIRRNLICVTLLKSISLLCIRTHNSFCVIIIDQTTYMKTKTWLKQKWSIPSYK
jgi:hypothetical protein